MGREGHILSQMLFAPTLFKDQIWTPLEKALACFIDLKITRDSRRTGEIDMVMMFKNLGSE